jgi:hypothetical protein
VARPAGRNPVKSASADRDLASAANNFIPFDGDDGFVG